MLHSLLRKIILGLSGSLFYTTVKDCGGGMSIFTVNSVSLTPPNPTPGQDVGLTLDYTVPPGMYVTNGQVEYAITYNFIPFAPSYEPLCANVPCPLTPNTYKNTSFSKWPTGLSGSVTTKMSWLDLDENLLLCVQISGQMGDLKKVALTER